MKSIRDQVFAVQLVEILLVLALIAGVVLLAIGLHGDKQGTAEIEQVSAIGDIVNNAKPTRIITQVNYTDNGETLKGKYTTQYDRADNLGQFDFSYERIAIPGESSSATSKETISGTVYSKDGSFSYDDCATWQGGGSGYLDYSLDISESKFTSYEISEDGNSITAVVSPENAKRVFGTNISADGDIVLSVVTSGTDVYSVSITYTTVSGAAVSIDTSYESLIIDLDF